MPRHTQAPPIVCSETEEHDEDNSLSEQISAVFMQKCSIRKQVVKFSGELFSYFCINPKV